MAIAAPTSENELTESAVMLIAHQDLKSAVDLKQHRRNLSPAEHIEVHMRTPNQREPHSH